MVLLAKANSFDRLTLLNKKKAGVNRTGNMRWGLSVVV
jgi:hypothetical protein